MRSSIQAAAIIFTISLLSFFSFRLFVLNELNCYFISRFDITKLTNSCAAIERVRAGFVINI